MPAGGPQRLTAPPSGQLGATRAGAGPGAGLLAVAGSAGGGEAERLSGGREVEFCKLFWRETS